MDSRLRGNDTGVEGECGAHCTFPTLDPRLRGNDAVMGENLKAVDLVLQVADEIVELGQTGPREAGGGEDGADAAG